MGRRRIEKAVIRMLALADLAAALETAGFLFRGAFHPAPEDGVPPLPDARAVGTLALAGNAGPALWRAFRRAAPDGPNPLDRWCARELGAIARRLDAALFLPQDGPPFLPFQRWARRAEAVHPSPLGLLIHPEYGLWHGYRGAFAFAEALALPAQHIRPSPCESCVAKPCLSACPVAAFGAQGYNVKACVSHAAAPEGWDCLDRGCRARHACPVGRTYAYAPDQARHHMAAFLEANRARH